MKKYINFSKKCIEKRINIFFDIHYKMIKAKPYIKQLKSIINLTNEEIDIIEKATKIIEDKGKLLENLLEDESIIFYDLD